MSQQIPHACPNVTCRAFMQPFDVECTDEPSYGPGFYEAVCDDEMDCGCCPTSAVPVTMLDEALERLFPACLE